MDIVDKMCSRGDFFLGSMISSTLIPFRCIVKEVVTPNDEYIAHLPSNHIIHIILWVPLRPVPGLSESTHQILLGI